VYTLDLAKPIVLRNPYSRCRLRRLVIASGFKKLHPVLWFRVCLLPLDRCKVELFVRSLPAVEFHSPLTLPGGHPDARTSINLFISQKQLCLLLPLHCLRHLKDFFASYRLKAIA
jgi:hypothetical protein